MKKKIFFEPGVMYFAFLLFLFGVCFWTFAVWYSIKEHLYLYAVFSLGAIPLNGWILISTIWPRTDCIIVADTYAEWRCFLKRKRRVYYDECRYIAVENFNKESHTIFPQRGRMPMW